MKTILNRKMTQVILSVSTVVLLSACGGGGNTTGSGNGPGATVLDCNLGAGETLTLTNHTAGTDYIIDCIYTIKGTMVIEPGVTIEFLSDTGLDLDGNQASLKAAGTQAEPITFTSADALPGAWRGIFIDSDNVKNELSHTIIEYAGGGAFNSNGDKGSVIIYAGAHLKATNNVLKDGKSYGFDLNYNGSDVVLKNNTIISHKAPIYTRANYTDAITGGSYTGNDTDAIIVRKSSLGGENRFRDLGVPYHIVGKILVGQDGKLTIDPGVTMKFGQNVSLHITNSAWNGNEDPYLNAIGTPNKKITFTSIASNGLWKGIIFNTQNSLNKIHYSTIKNAKEGISAWYHTKLSIDTDHFKDIDNHAIHVASNNNTTDDVHITGNNTFTNVGGVNIKVDSPVNPWW